MLNKLQQIFLVIFFSCISITCLSTSRANIKQIVIFGDSYSDIGNTYHASKHTYPGPAYYSGHFQDGINWSEYFSEKIGVSFTNPKQFRNYAYGQAQNIGEVTLKTHQINSPNLYWNFTIPDLSGEINQYLKEGNLNPSNTLFFIFIGTNDILNYTPKSRKENQWFVHQELISLNTQINRLRKIGAKHIVLFNIRDLQQSPLAYQLAEKYKNNYIQSLNQMISDFNRALENNYQLANDVIIYDINKFDRTVFDKNSSYRWHQKVFNLKEKNNPCYHNSGNYIDKIEEPCNKPWEHLFYDRIHQTTFINKMLSNDLYSFLYNNHWRFSV